MFERFTDRARRVLVLAQEEARLLEHGFIGTEHLLLGLVHEGGVAAEALRQIDVSLEAVRERVVDTVGQPGGPPSGSPPFTPRARKVLELSLREALALGHNYIGTEHILLGIVGEGEGVGAQVLLSMGANLPTVRRKVLELLGRPAESGWASYSPSAPRRAGLVRCSFCGLRPPDSGRIVSSRNAFICEHCIDEWYEKLAAGSEETGNKPVVQLYEAEDEAQGESGGPPD